MPLNVLMVSVSNHRKVVRSASPVLFLWAIFVMGFLLAGCASIQERQARALAWWNRITGTASGAVAGVQEKVGDVVEVGKDVAEQGGEAVENLKEAAEDFGRRVDSVQSGIEKIQEGKDLIKAGVTGGTGSTK